MSGHSLAVQRASGEVSIPAKYAAAMWVLMSRVLIDLRMLESDARIERMSKDAALRAAHLLSDAIHNLPRTLVDHGTELAPTMIDIAIESLRSASREIWGDAERYGSWIEDLRENVPWAADDPTRQILAPVSERAH